jgi:hypothetical protein
MLAALLHSALYSFLAGAVCRLVEYVFVVGGQWLRTYFA